MSDPIDVWGLAEGRCAWCLLRATTDSYIGTDTQGDTVRYHTCEVCYVEFAPSAVRSA
jgi:hypothetical protein